jgi:tetratricopeptide (TPR) repeat protein
MLLGVVLYELLAGVPPHRPAPGAHAALGDALLARDPKRPSDSAADPQRRRQLRGDLDTIVLKALKPAAAERYATVNALAEDIVRHLEQRPVLARPDSLRYRLQRFVRRNRLAVGAATLAALLLIGGVVAIAWQGRVAVDERRRAEGVKDFIASVFLDADPYRGSTGPVPATELLRRAYERISPAVVRRADTRVELLTLIGEGLKNLQDQESAAKVLDDAVAQAQGALGERHALTLRARIARLGVMRFQGRSADGRKELQTLLPLLREAADHPADLVSALLSKAHFAVDDDRIDEAIGAAGEALAIARGRLGDADEEAANAAALLAIAHERTGRPQEALKAAELALALHRLAGGRPATHVDIISARVAYARALGEAGELERSLSEFDAAIGQAAERFGGQAIEVGFFKQNAVKYLLEAGDLARAEGMAADAARIFAGRTDLAPHFHPVARMTHASVWLAARRAAAALPELQAAATPILASLGPRHPQSQRASEFLALAEGRTGRVDDALRRLQTLIDAEPAGRWVWRPLRAQSVLSRLAGRDGDALRQARAALAAVGGPRADIDRMRVLPDLGLALVAGGDLVEARRVLDEALALCERFQGRASPERSDVALGLGRVHLAQSRPAEALPWFEQAMAFWRAQEPEGRAAAEAELWWARAQAALGHGDAARRGFGHAARLLARSPLPGERALAATVLP